MNCDHVFAVLTSGPFPRGAHDDASVERHLDACPSCWRIAEALRPAADLFEEALPAAQARLLPGYHCQAQISTVVSQQRETIKRRARPCASRPTHNSPVGPGSFGPVIYPQATVPRYYIEGNSSWLEVARVAVFFGAVAMMAFVACYWLR